MNLQFTILMGGEVESRWKFIQLFINVKENKKYAAH